jgi:hypothetical protein
MASTFPPRLTAVTIDCADPERLGSFWSALLGVEVEEREEEVVARSPTWAARSSSATRRTAGSGGWWPTPRATRPAWSSPPTEGRVSAGGRW